MPVYAIGTSIALIKLFLVFDNKNVTSLISYLPGDKKYGWHATFSKQNKIRLNLISFR